MPSFTIRPATPTDRAQVADFNLRLAEETEAKILDRATLESGVAALLADPAKGRYFLAETASGEAVGQMMFTFEWSDWRDGFFWWLQSIYVVPEFRKQGVFSELFEHVTALARTDPGVCGVRLYVDRENAPALATYGSRGFERANYEMMELVFSDRPED